MNAKRRNSSVIRNEGLDKETHPWRLIFADEHGVIVISMTIEELDDLRTQLWSVVRDNQV